MVGAGAVDGAVYLDILSPGLCITNKPMILYLLTLSVYSAKMWQMMGKRIWLDYLATLRVLYKFLNIVLAYIIYFREYPMSGRNSRNHNNYNYIQKPYFYYKVFRNVFI